MALAVVALSPRRAIAQTVLDSPELYPGEKALYEAAKKEGMVVSFDTGPDLGQLGRASSPRSRSAIPRSRSSTTTSARAATVVALDKARNRPQADTAYYFAASAIDAVARTSSRRSSR